MRDARRWKHLETLRQEQHNLGTGTTPSHAASCKKLLFPGAQTPPRSPSLRYPNVPGPILLLSYRAGLCRAPEGPGTPSDAGKATGGPAGGDSWALHAGGWEQLMAARPLARKLNEGAIKSVKKELGSTNNRSHRPQNHLGLVSAPLRSSPAGEGLPGGLGCRLGPALRRTRGTRSAEKEKLGSIPSIHTQTQPRATPSLPAARAAGAPNTGRSPERLKHPSETRINTPGSAVRTQARAVNAQASPRAAWYDRIPNVAAKEAAWPSLR